MALILILSFGCSAVVVRSSACLSAVVRCCLTVPPSAVVSTLSLVDDVGGCAAMLASSGFLPFAVALVAASFCGVGAWLDARTVTGGADVRSADAGVFHGLVFTQPSSWWVYLICLLIVLALTMFDSRRHVLHCLTKVVCVMLPFMFATVVIKAVRESS